MNPISNVPKITGYLFALLVVLGAGHAHAVSGGGAPEPGKSGPYPECGKIVAYAPRVQCRYTKLDAEPMVVVAAPVNDGRGRGFCQFHELDKRGNPLSFKCSCAGAVDGFFCSLSDGRGGEYCPRGTRSAIRCESDLVLPERPVEFIVDKKSELFETVADWVRDLDFSEVCGLDLVQTKRKALAESLCRSSAWYRDHARKGFQDSYLRVPCCERPRW